MKRWEKSQFRVGDEGDDTPSPFSSPFVLDSVRGREEESYFCIIIILFYCIIVLLYYLYYYCIILLIRI